MACQRDTGITYEVHACIVIYMHSLCMKKSVFIWNCIHAQFILVQNQYCLHYDYCATYLSIRLFSFLVNGGLAKDIVHGCMFLISFKGGEEEIDPCQGWYIVVKDRRCCLHGCRGKDMVSW